MAKAHICALQRLLKEEKAKMEYFNVGTGTGSSVLEVINAFEKVNDMDLKYKIVDRREGDITSAYADTKWQMKNWDGRLNSVLKRPLLPHGSGS